MSKHPDITRETINQRLSQRVNAGKLIIEHLGPKSLTDLARATGVNRQTITNAMNARESIVDNALGRPPTARTKLAKAINEILPDMDRVALAEKLRDLASRIERGSL